MKYIATLSKMLFAFLATATAVVSCKYDDGPLWDEINSITERVEKLEKATGYLTVQVSGLQELIEQIQENNLVESVIQQEDGDWTIVFSNGKEVEIIYEKIEEITIPTLTVVKEGETYYWAYQKGDKVEKLMSGGVPVEVNPDVEPCARVTEDDFTWELSFDGGVSWVGTEVVATGEGTDTLFAGVSEDEDHFFVTLTDGTVLPLAKAKGLSFKFVPDDSFDGEELYLKAGITQVITVSQTSVASAVCFKPDGWKAELSGDSFIVTSPSEDNTFAEIEGYAGVIATGNEGQTVISKFFVAQGDRPAKAEIKTVWTTAEEFFTELRFGSAYESGAIDLKPSNTFLVRPGQLYRFKANVMGRGTEGVTALGLNEAKNQIEDFVIYKDASIHSSLKGNKEYIYFRVTEEPWMTLKAGEPIYYYGGTGVISLTLDGVTAWTWMVWSREEDPVDQVVGDYTQMGAWLGGWGPVWAWKYHIGDYMKSPFTPNLGLYYSWGGINPQPGHTEQNRCFLNTGTTLLGANMNLVYYYDTGVAVERTIRQGLPVQGLSESIKHPEVLNDLTSDGEDIYKNLWGGVSGSDKTIFDPCPYGYRVPDAGLYASYQLGGVISFGHEYPTSTGTEQLFYTGMIGMGETDVKSGYKPTKADQETAMTPCFVDIGIDGDYTKLAGDFWSNETGSASTATVYRVLGKSNKGDSEVDRRNAAPLRCIRFDGEK